MQPKHAHGHTDTIQSWTLGICFGCGPANPFGLHLNFELGPKQDSYICHFELGVNFSGPPSHAHGGIIATILDEAMGKALKLKGKVALTRNMSVDYLRPVPLGQPLVVEGHVVRVRGRALYNRAEIRSDKGVVLACSRGKFLAIDPEKMFAREYEAEMRRREQLLQDKAVEAST
jgi:uncharacterized protein (TIGR00369 family)